LTENGGASDAQDDSLSVAENCCDLVTSGALDIHEKGVGVLNQTLQLALALFLLREGMQQILRERHILLLNELERTSVGACSQPSVQDNFPRSLDKTPKGRLTI